MKKLVTSIIAIFLCASVLVGCGSKDISSNSEVVEITFWAHQNPSWNASYEEIIQKFEEENPNIKVKFEHFPYDDYESKVQTSLIEEGNGADLYEIWGGWAIDFAPSGALEPIPEDLAKTILEDTYKPTTGSLVVDGKLYGLPLEFNIEMGGLIINKKLMDKMGLKAPTTWQELVDTAVKGTVMDKDNFVVKGFDFVNWDSIPYMFMSMILSQGGQYLNDDGTVNFDTPEAKKAFEELAGLVVEKKVTNLEGLTSGGELEGYQALYADQVLMVPRGPWAISEGIEVFGLEYGKDFEYVKLPFYSTLKKFSSETGWALAINSKSSKKEAAMKLLEYFNKDDVLLNNNIKCTQIPPKKSVAHDAKIADSMPYSSILVDILEEAQFIGYFNTDILKEKINNTFVEYCNGEFKSVDEAMKSLNEKLSDLKK